MSLCQNVPHSFERSGDQEETFMTLLGLIHYANTYDNCERNVVEAVGLTTGIDAAALPQLRYSQ